MRILLFPMLLLASFARADNIPAGGGSTGGGNMLDGKMMEEYYRDPADLKGDAIFEQKMDLLRKAAPVFADMVREQTEEMSWYVVPMTLPDVPNSQVDLPFHTYQGLIQGKSEIFANQDAYDKATDQTVAFSMMHESVMALLKDKKSVPVRKLVDRIFSPKATPQSIQKALLDSGFGVYFSDDQLLLQRKEYFEDFKKYLSEQMDTGLENCDAGVSLEQWNEQWKSKKMNLWSHMPFEYLNWSIYLAQIGKDYVRDEKYGDSSKGFSGTKYDGIIARYACQNNVDQFSPPACEQLADFTRTLGGNSVWSSSEDDLDKKAPLAALERLHGASKADRMELFEQLVRRPDYMNILAAFPAGASPDEDMDLTCFEPLSDCSQKSTAWAKAMKPKVLARRAELASYSPEEKRKLYCDSLKSLRKDVLNFEFPGASKKMPTPVSDKEMQGGEEDSSAH